MIPMSGCFSEDCWSLFIVQLLSIWPISSCGQSEFLFFPLLKVEYREFAQVENTFFFFFLISPFYLSPSPPCFEMWPFVSLASAWINCLQKIPSQHRLWFQVYADVMRIEVLPRVLSNILVHYVWVRITLTIPVGYPTLAGWKACGKGGFW